MGELSFQLDWLKSAIATARRRQGSSYWKRNYVISLARLDEDRYRRRRNFTFAMYMRHLRLKLEASKTTQSVLDALMFHVEHTPASNTGVNLDESSNEPKVTVIQYGR